MKKYIIKELYNEYDNGIYFDMLKQDIIEGYSDSIFIGFNKEFIGVNDELINTIRYEIINYSDYVIEAYYKNNLSSFIIEQLKPYKNISLKQAIKIAQIARCASDNEFYGSNYKAICEVLSIIYNKAFNCECLRGYSQGDWIYCFYSSDINKQFIDYIEAVYFNTGIELYISDEPIDIPTDGNIDSVEYDGTGDYCVNYYKDELKKYISDNYGIKDDEMIIYCIKNVRTITSYKIEYEEIK